MQPTPASTCPPQVQRKCIDRSISIAGIQKLFEDADTHVSGYLDYLEFRSFCEDLGLEVCFSDAGHEWV